jgi:outer membrane lipopolysaccharide assembly protein LptE/RlpB
MLNRPRYILLPTLLSLALLLQGCGFKLRTPPSYDLTSSVSPMFIKGLARNDVLKTTLEEELNAAGVEITKDPKAATTTLSLSNHRSGRRITALDERGKAAEYELQEAITFTLISNAGVQMVPKQKVTALRTYTDTRNQVLGKEGEAVSLRVILRQDLAGQILRRLGTQLK